MVKFLLWCILLVFCWPLALLALVLYRLFVLAPAAAVSACGYRGGWRWSWWEIIRCRVGFFDCLTRRAPAASSFSIPVLPGRTLANTRLSTSLPGMH